MAANWPTHRVRRSIRAQRLRWEAKVRKREREGMIRAKAPRAVRERAAIADATWEAASR